MSNNMCVQPACNDWEAAIRAADDQLFRLRQSQLHPSYRRRLLGNVEGVEGATTLRVLRCIERMETNQSSPSIRDVALALEVDQSTASRAVNAATQNQLVERRPCIDDNRRVRLALTAAGRAAAQRATANRRMIVTDALDGWDIEDVQTLCRLLDRLNEGLRPHGDERGSTNG